MPLGPSIAPLRKGERLAILMPGLGAVASTTIAGIEAVKKRLGSPVGSLTQLGNLLDENGVPGPSIRSVLPLAGLEDLVFGAWDPIPHNAYEAALRAGVLDRNLLADLREELEGVTPMPAVFDTAWVRRIDGPNVKKGSMRAQAQALCDDIHGFLKRNRCGRGVMMWTGSTEVFAEVSAPHRTIASFEAALDRDDPAIAPSMIYAWAALKTGIPFVNGSPNLAADIPALRELAGQEHVPTAGKDFKTGQTLMKTTIAPMLRARLLGLEGWFSTNILGNRDGEVLDDEAAFRTKEASKLSVLESILDRDVHPDLYADAEHKVAINYYRARGDNKEAWDAIDIFGWLGYTMQIKINFQCRDSILAAPLVLDLALFADLASRAGEAGPLEWLSFFFKSPETALGRRPTHDLFHQERELHRVLRKYSEKRSAAGAALG